MAEEKKKEAKAAAPRPEVGEGNVLYFSNSGRFVILPKHTAEKLLRAAKDDAYRKKTETKARVVCPGEKAYDAGVDEALGKNYDTQKGERKREAPDA